MRLLCVYYNYPQLSATYIEAEIQFLVRQGVEVAVWAETDPGSPYEASCRVYRGSLASAEQTYQPDIVHFYWLKMYFRHSECVTCPNITIRSHSFEIQSEDIAFLQQDPRIKGLFMFPHQTSRLPSLNKVIPLPVVYDSERFPPKPPLLKKTDLVVCCTGGLPKKALEVFFGAAALCQNIRFVLALATCSGHEKMVDWCVDMNREFDQPVNIQVDLPHNQVALLLREAAIYFCTQRVTKRGMPIAIAEALASGCYVLTPNFPWLAEMFGIYGTTYHDAIDSATHISECQKWTSSEWEKLSRGAVEYAFGKYADQIILPKRLKTWHEMLES